jgi:hypothetical protein
MAPVSHLVNLWGKRGLRVDARFAQVRRSSADRKELARQLYDTVVTLRNPAAT